MLRGCNNYSAKQNWEISFLAFVESLNLTWFDEQPKTIICTSFCTTPPIKSKQNACCIDNCTENCYIMSTQIENAKKSYLVCLIFTVKWLKYLVLSDNRFCKCKEAPCCYSFLLIETKDSMLSLSGGAFLTMTIKIPISLWKSRF